VSSLLGVLFGVLPDTVIVSVDLANLEHWKTLRKEKIQWIQWVEPREHNNNDNEIRTGLAAVTAFFVYFLRTIEEDIGISRYAAKEMKFSDRHLRWHRTIMKSLGERSLLALHFGTVLVFFFFFFFVSFTVLVFCLSVCFNTIA